MSDMYISSHLSQVWLAARQYDPGTQPVHVVLLQVPELGRVAVDPPPRLRTLLGLLQPLQGHPGVGGVHQDLLEAQASEEGLGLLQGQEDSHTERPLDGCLQGLLEGGAAY